MVWVGIGRFAVVFRVAFFKQVALLPPMGLHDLQRQLGQNFSPGYLGTSLGSSVGMLPLLLLLSLLETLLSFPFWA